jgi:hypothetical protein
VNSNNIIFLIKVKQGRDIVEEDKLFGYSRIPAFETAAPTWYFVSIRPA